MSTLLHRLYDWANEKPDAPAQKYKVGDEWKTITAKEFWERTFYSALYLESKGFEAHDCIAVLSYNRPEWVHVDLAAHLLGGKSTGLYPNSSVKDAHYIMNHSESKVLAVQNEEYFNKLKDEGQDFDVPDRLRLIISFDDETGFSPLAVTYRDIIAKGKELSAGKDPQKYLQNVDKDDGKFIIYTSGTTGSPKGGMISHDNMIYIADTIMKHWDIRFEGERSFSFLPLCHVAERTHNLGVGICCRMEMFYCTKFENVAADLQSVQPTLLLSVPRVWEKMMEGVEAKLQAAPPKKQKLARWAMNLGRKSIEAQMGIASMGLKDHFLLKIADRIVLSKVREKLGLNAIHLCASGAAKLPKHVNEWFRGLGIEITEIFGSTESTCIVTLNEPGVEGAGTVGKVFPESELRLAEDGEVLCRGRQVFKGYYKNPDETAKTIDEDGWLHTGDLGVFNERGQLIIKGRKKEVMKTSGGKMTAPVPIEEQVKQAPIISQVCMVGDGRKYFSALVTLVEDANSKVPGGFKTNGSRTIKDENVLKEVQKTMDEVNSSLAQFEQIKYFKVLKTDFSIDGGEMTPTLKMKRAVIEEKYQDVIDSMYS